MEFENVTEFAVELAEDGVRIARDNFDMELDFGLESLQGVDAILLTFHEDLENLDDESIGALATSFGAYAGECVRRAHMEAQWPADFHEDGIGHITLNWLGWQAPVFGIAYGRITEGSRHSVWQLYQDLRKRVASPAPGDAALPPKPGHDPLPGHPVSPDDAASIRHWSLERLAALELQAAPGLPLPNARGPQVLRPAEEIARLLMGLHATVAWCCAPEAMVPSDLLVDYVDRQGIFDVVSDRERDLLNQERGQAAKQAEKVGWYTENMWALAWVLGLDQTPGIDGQMIPDSVGPAMAQGLLRGFTATVEEVASTFGLRPLDEVLQLEDTFYCAHNAYRSLALRDQNLVFPCGVIQERRHALTWVLSPDVEWDDVDLST